MAKRGRPIDPNAKRDGIRFRLRADQVKMLRDLSEKTGKSRTELFVGLIEQEYERVIGKEK